MNEREQLELENYLREFRPCAPRALPATNTTQSWRRLAAAVALFVAASASIWSAYRRPAKPFAANRAIPDAVPSASPIVLTHLALEEPSEFATRMDRQAIHTLQRFDRPDSSLRVLAGK